MFHILLKDSNIKHCDNKENKSIIYWDTNNLYGWETSQCLPYSGFNWLSRKEINSFCLGSISENSTKGFF